MVQLTIGGATVGATDDAYAVNNVSQEFDLGSVSPQAGNVAFVFTTPSKNSASSDFT